MKAFVNPGEFGFSPSASGIENKTALQKALDMGGTVVVTEPGIYRLAGTVFIGGDTTLSFGNGCVIQKVNEEGEFTHVLLNKGALTKTYDKHIAVENLQIIVNGVDIRKFLVFGLHGQLAFFYVKDLRISGFRCLDLGPAQYAIHICTFEDVIVEDVIVKGKKDGVHLGRGKRFTIRNGVFETGDDAIALNAHDYDVGNPELGWIEDGVVENIHDLADDKNEGYICRILAGAWVDWFEGMEVQKSDTVVSGGRLYRVSADADGKTYISRTRPTHVRGTQTLDGISWAMVQEDVTYTAGVRNVVFRDIFQKNPRTAFSVHFDNDRFSRSYYPGAQIPAQEQLVFDNVRILHDARKPFLSIATPVDIITVRNASLKDSYVEFISNKAMKNYQKTKLNFIGCVFQYKGEMDFVVNKVPGKEIELKTTASVEYYDTFSARVLEGPGRITVDSDLSGLKVENRK